MIELPAVAGYVLADIGPVSSLLLKLVIAVAFNVFPIGPSCPAAPPPLKKFIRSSKPLFVRRAAVPFCYLFAAPFPSKQREKSWVRL